MKISQYTCALICMISGYLQAKTEQMDFVIIDKIAIEGHVKTKREVITRELTFRIGDTIPLLALSGKLQESKERLVSTALFTSVVISTPDSGADKRITVSIKVLETWFIYPVPIFSLADRNFNVWWDEKGHALSRINVGLQLTYNNFTGQRDPLRLTIQGGYTPKVAFSYEFPYLNKAQTVGLATSFNYSQNKELIYATAGNRTLFADNADLSPMIRQIAWDASLFYRPGLYLTHVWDIGFSNKRISDTIAKDLNPGFFLDSANIQRYWTLSYAFSYDRRDIKFYPKKGYYLNGYVQKNGILGHDNANDFLVGMRFGGYLSFDKRFSFETVGHVETDLDRGQKPYNLNKALGYGGDFLRGYEYYVVDGIDFGIIKNTLRFEFFDYTANLKQYMPLKAFRLAPIAGYLTLDGDAGFTNDPYSRTDVNSFPNRLLYSYGLGLNLVFYYDMVFKIEYSINHLNQGGVYLHYQALF